KMAMDLTTRCPQCGTEFQASLQQLQLRKGYIRCVNCAHIFDGYEAVVPAEPVGSGGAAAGARASGGSPEPSRANFSISGSDVSAAEPDFVVSGSNPPEAGIPLRTRPASRPEPSMAPAQASDEHSYESERHTLGESHDETDSESD